MFTRNRPRLAWPEVFLTSLPHAWSFASQHKPLLAITMLHLRICIYLFWPSAHSFLSTQNKIGTRKKVEMEWFAIYSIRYANLCSIKREKKKKTKKAATVTRTIYVKKFLSIKMKHHNKTHFNISTVSLCPPSHSLGILKFFF